MTQKQLQDLVDRDPFQPLRITLSSGESIDVKNPRLVVVMRTQFFIALAEDRYKLVLLRHVSSIEVQQAA